MQYDKNGNDIKFPSFECLRNDCDKRMNKDKTAPDHYKSTGNYRYVCKNKHLRWMSLEEINRYAAK